MNKNELKHIIIEILKEKNIRKASFFGSIVNGDFNSDSDIDILVEYEDKTSKTLLDLIELKSILEEKTKSKIDLVTYDSINPIIRQNIINSSESIYG